MQQPPPGEQHQPPPARTRHQHADVAIGQLLLAQVAAVEHGRAQRPGLHRASQSFPQQGPLHPLHPPGALADRAEQNQPLEFVEQGPGARVVGGSGLRVEHAKGIRQLRQALLVLA